MSKSTIKLLPPDGGYGYVIVFAVIINLTIFGSYTNYYGILFRGYFTELNLNSTDINTLNGFSGICAAAAGFLTAPLLKVLSKRKIGWLAAILYNCGMICTVFAKTKTVFFIFQGVVQGAGCGLMFNISITVLNDYFVEKRFLAISLAQTLSAFACLLAPQFYQWSQNVFGHRSTLIWACALSIHLFVGVTLLQPVKKHMKKVEISAKETEVKLLLQETDLSLSKEEEANKASTTIDDKNDVKEDKVTVISFFKSFVDLEIVRSFVLSIHCLGPTLCMATELTFSLMLPQALQSYGWNEVDIAWAFSFLFIGDLFMRTALILLSKWLNKLGSRGLYIIGIIVAFLTRIGILMVHNRKAVLFFITLMGISRCVILVVVIMVISEAVPTEKYTAAFGYFMLTSGITNLTLGPVLGVVRDYTGSYTITFYIMTAVFGIVGVIWLLMSLCSSSTKKIYEEEPKKINEKGIDE